jgi:hypothetical protein
MRTVSGNHMSTLSPHFIGPGIADRVALKLTLLYQTFPDVLVNSVVSGWFLAYMEHAL